MTHRQRGPRPKALPKALGYSPGLADLTPAGVQELGRLLGLKGASEGFYHCLPVRGKELPIYALGFGGADRMAEQIKALSPPDFFWAKSLLPKHGKHLLPRLTIP